MASVAMYTQNTGTKPKAKSQVKHSNWNGKRNYKFKKSLVKHSNWNCKLNYKLKNKIKRH